MLTLGLRRTPHRAPLETLQQTWPTQVALRGTKDCALCCGLRYGAHKPRRPSVDSYTAADDNPIRSRLFRSESFVTPVWNLDDSGALVGSAARTDFYINPAGPDGGDAESMLNGATLLGTPPAGDFQFSARVSVDFVSQYDAGVLMIWIDEQHWAKFCFEFSPDAEPMVVSVVTREFSDDANSFVIPDRSIWLRIARRGRVYAFHASTDGNFWRLVRAFTLGDELGDHQIGFEVQAPTGDGCTVSSTTSVSAPPASWTYATAPDRTGHQPAASSPR